MAEYDITSKMARFLDPHLLLQLLTNLEKKNVYPTADIRKKIGELVSQETELYSLLTEYVGADDERLRQVGDKTDDLTKLLGPLAVACDAGTSEHQALMNCQQPLDLTQHGVTQEKSEALYQWAKENYKGGVYYKAIAGLNLYQHLLKCHGNGADESEMKRSFQRNLAVKWGLLAAYIAEKSWPEAANVACALDAMLEDVEILSKKEILNQRTFLMHWTLFILFKSAEPKVVDLFMSEKYLALISLRCPWMLRYVAATLIMNKKLKGMTKDIIHVLKQDECLYSDALTEFLLSLHQDMDFDVAKEKLTKAQEMIKIDFFLCSNEEAIMSNARLGIFSTYCRIHESVDINTISEKMGMSPEDAEDWIVDLIQTNKLTNARIDAQKGKKEVFFPKEESEVYSQVLEKTKNTSFRLFLLQANAGTLVDKKKPGQLTSIASTLAAHLLN